MAWLEEHPTSGHFKICFRWDGRKLKKTVKTTSREKAEAALLRFEETLSLLERGRLELPPGADVATFLLSDGKLARKPTATPAPKAVTLAELRDRYLESHANGAMEANSLATVRMHLNHFVATLGGRFAAQALTLADLQRHVDRRARVKYRGKNLSPVTLKKEMASFRACWNWGVDAGQVTGRFPGRGLKYPKADERPPFQTRDEIERRIALGGLTQEEIEALWDCLYLRVNEIEELLGYVRENAIQPWVYPLFCFAAHTGARRSEMLRVLVSDLDFDGMTVLVREKKRSRSQRTTRRVSLSPFLAEVLKGWLNQHPGGQFLFCQAPEVSRSKKRGRTTGHRGGADAGQEPERANGHSEAPFGVAGGGGGHEGRGPRSLQTDTGGRQVGGAPGLPLPAALVHFLPGHQGRGPAHHRRVRRAPDGGAAPALPAPDAGREAGGDPVSLWRVAGPRAGSGAARRGR